MKSLNTKTVEGLDLEGKIPLFLKGEFYSSPISEGYLNKEPINICVQRFSAPV